MNNWIAGLLIAGGVCLAARADEALIDRQAVVTRYNIRWNDAQGVVPLGNGEFCFGADGTGLQTFAGNAMSHWGWHSFPLPKGYTPDQVPPTGTFQQGRNMGPDIFPADKADLRKWLFDNPHIMNLGRLRLCRADNADITTNAITGLSRTLDLWSGVQTSSYTMDGEPVRVVTCVLPSLDAVAVRIESPLIARAALRVALDFPYPSLRNDAWVGDFGREEGHTVDMTPRAERRADFLHAVETATSHVSLAWSAGCTLASAAERSRKKLSIKKAAYGDKDTWLDVTGKVAARVEHDGVSIRPSYSWLGDPLPGKAKRLRLTYAQDGAEKNVEIADGATFVISNPCSPYRFVLSAAGTDRLEFVCAFAPEKCPERLPTVDDALGQAAAHWERFWKSGGAIDLAGSKDRRWMELERRVVLSQYNMAAQTAGSWPSSESGLLGIDPWRGQFHMEMVWWHLAHYALWDRWDMADKAVGCYRRFAPAARELAAQLGYKGLKWQKSVGPEGRTAPWVGNQVLLWKQPHPIFFAELEYRLHPTRATLDKWADIVQGTAEHMADYPTLNEQTGLYSLAPAMPPSEQGVTRDTVFDLAYWRWGLDKAREWRQRLGLPREPHWDAVRQRLAPLPVVDGAFVHSAEWSDTYTKRAFEHPDPVGVFGMLPPTEGVERETAHRTVLKVWEKWNWNRCWGWDCPWMAMAAARVGEPRLAVEALLKDSTRNQFDTRGINTGGPCPYLPGNGGLLYAVAMMAAGWDGAPEGHAPGFPADGSWVVKWEGLKKAP